MSRLCLMTLIGRFFLRTLGEACKRAGFGVHAFVLMTNHYHLPLQAPEANLSAGMGWFQNAYMQPGVSNNRLT